MIERIFQMIKKELIQIFRDPRMKPVIFGVPVLQLIVFGYAVTTDIRDVSTAIFDRSKSSESRELIQMIQASGYFNTAFYPESEKEAGMLLDSGQVLCMVEIDSDFSKDIARKSPAGIQIIVDGSDSNTATVAAGYITRIAGAYAKKYAVQRKIPVIEIRDQAWYNPALKSRNYNVPGVIAIMLMIICLLLTSMAVVREREIGTIEQLMVTPLHPFEIIAGKTVPFALIGFFDMFLVTAIGINWFKIPMKGSFLLLFGCIAVYLISVLGIGLFISTISKTQQQALMATFLFFAPAILLSGFMFPIENMPDWIQPITLLNPLRYILVIIRGIFLKGNNLQELYHQILPLFAIGVSVFSLSVLRFKKNIE